MTLNYYKIIVAYRIVYYNLKKKTIESQDYKMKYFDKRLFALEYTPKRTTNLVSTTVPSSSKYISKSISSSSLSSFSSLTKDVFGKTSKPMFLPKSSSIEDNKELNNDKDNKTETSLVKNETTLSTNDRKRKAEDETE